MSFRSRFTLGNFKYLYGCIHRVRYSRDSRRKKTKIIIIITTYAKNGGWCNLAMLLRVDGFFFCIYFPKFWLRSCILLFTLKQLFVGRSNYNCIFDDNNILFWRLNNNIIVPATIQYLGRVYKKKKKKIYTT